MKILGLKSLKATLKKLVKKYGPAKPSVVVGYTANYAVYVHENKSAKHKAGKSAKFLEGPARAKSKQISDKIEGGLKIGVALDDALLLGGQQLQRESEIVVPIEFGALRGSAFTAKEKDADEAAAVAYSNFKSIKARSKR